MTTNFVAIGWLGNFTVYFGVGLTKEQAWERFQQECDPESLKNYDFAHHIRELRATDKFHAYQISECD